MRTPGDPSSGDYDYATVAIDALSGTQLWVARYRGPKYEDDLASAIGISPDGSLITVTIGVFVFTAGMTQVAFGGVPSQREPATQAAVVGSLQLAPT